MAQFPISTEDASREIKSLIAEKGLEVITSKMIRKHLEAKFNCDFEECKSNLDPFIETCIMDMIGEGELNANKPTEKIEKVEEKTASSDSSLSDDEELRQEIKDFNKSSNSKISARKRRIHNSSETIEKEAEDMATAIKRRRNTVIPKKKEKQIKTKEKPRTVKKTMFTKICVLSSELSSLLGKRYMRRSDVVKAMWNYFRTNNLQDPKSKQYYFLDESLSKVFGKGSKRIKAFGMMGKLKNHVKDIEHLDEITRQLAEAEIAEMLASESKTEQQQGNDSDDAEGLGEESNDNGKEHQETSQIKIEAEDSNISMSSQQSVAKLDELDSQPSTSMSASQQEAENENGQQQQSSGSSDSPGSESSSDDSGTEDY